jgi:transposase
MECRVLQFNDLSRSLLAFDQNSTGIAAIELSLDRWLVGAIKQIEDERLRQLHDAPQTTDKNRVQQLARVKSLGIETADMLSSEVFPRRYRDQRAIARYAGLTGSPDESGRRRREKGRAKVGNARVRRGMIHLAWRFLRYQPDSTLVQWYRARVAGGKKPTVAIVALARKLLIALWRLVTIGEVPQGWVLA